MGVRNPMDTSVTHEDFVAAIERAQDNVIDTDLAVDAARGDADRALSVLRDAVQQRRRAIDHLEHLIGCANPEAA
jgi:t-SNARE complex subunit (syntaxin)